MRKKTYNWLYKTEILRGYYEEPDEERKEEFGGIISCYCKSVNEGAYDNFYECDAYRRGHILCGK